MINIRDKTDEVGFIYRKEYSALVTDGLTEEEQTWYLLLIEPNKNKLEKKIPVDVTQNIPCSNIVFVKPNEDWTVHDGQFLGHLVHVDNEFDYSFEDYQRDYFVTQMEGVTLVSRSNVTVKFKKRVKLATGAVIFE